MLNDLSKVVKLVKRARIQTQSRAPNHDPLPSSIALTWLTAPTFQAPVRIEQDDGCESMPPT